MPLLPVSAPGPGEHKTLKTLKTPFAEESSFDASWAKQPLRARRPLQPVHTAKKERPITAPTTNISQIATTARAITNQDGGDYKKTKKRLIKKTKTFLDLQDMPTRDKKSGQKLGLKKRMQIAERFHLL